MPKELENKLKKLAIKKGLKGGRKNAYIYGTMNKIQSSQSSEVKKGR